MKNSVYFFPSANNGIPSVFTGLVNALKKDCSDSACSGLLYRNSDASVQTFLDSTSSINAASSSMCLDLQNDGSINTKGCQDSLPLLCQSTCKY